MPGGQLIEGRSVRIPRIIRGNAFPGIGLWRFPIVPNPPVKAVPVPCAMRGLAPLNREIRTGPFNPHRGICAS